MYDLELLPPAVEVEKRTDGSRILRSPVPLGPYPPTLSERLFHWVQATPERIFLGERCAGGWREVSYRAAGSTILGLAAGLLGRGLGTERPLAILSDNSVDSGLLMLAAMHVGVPVAMISPAYSLLPGDLEKLRAIGSKIRPALVYADDGQRYARALEVLAGLGGEPLVGDEGLAELGRPAAEFSSEVQACHAQTGPETVAKILFTSGSTGKPKGVINTQRMLCANQRAIAQLWPFLESTPPVLVDWLPWNHTFGGNHNFNMVVFHGGTLWIDGGKPAPGLFECTLQNLRERSPTLYFNVPRGYDSLLPALEADAALRERFFADLQVIFYAAAALPQSLWARLERLSERVCGRQIFMASAWGATETAPLCTQVHYPIPHAGVIGLPAPGAELKLVPVADKLEARVRAPWVTPGYIGEPELTAAAFDEEGFYRTGDAMRLADPEAPERGLVFAGRIAEDFKLTSGTWVHVGSLRVALIEASAPVVQDAVITGDGRAGLGALIFLSLAGARELTGNAEASLSELCRSPLVREHLRAGLAGHNGRYPQNSRRIDRVLLLAEPPLLSAGELTDKGYINQRAVGERRAGEVERLYSEDAAVIIVEPGDR